jgi:hypothetical protein
MTNITNEQLEAWAGLGPWEWQKLAEFSSPKHSLGPGVLLTDERDGTPWGDTIDQTNAALIAAAPALAAALLAERKAREVEVGELKRLQAERDSAILWIHWLANNPRKPMTWMQTREAAADFVANLDAALAKVEESK